MMETPDFLIEVTKNNELVTQAKFNTLVEMITFIHLLGLNSKHDMITIFATPEIQIRRISL